MVDFLTANTTGPTIPDVELELDEGGSLSHQQVNPQTRVPIVVTSSTDKHHLYKEMLQMRHQLTQ